MWVHRGMTKDPAANKLAVNPGDDPTGDEATLTAILEGYAQGGFDSSFGVTDASEVECHTCEVVSPASSVAMNSLRRMEGASDPDDMVAVVALTCPACGGRDQRGDATAPGNSAHGETRGDETPRPGLS